MPFDFKVLKYSEINSILWFQNLIQSDGVANQINKASATEVQISF